MTITSSNIYNDNSSKVNKDHIFNNLKQNYQEDLKEDAKKDMIEEPQKIEKEKQISKEEATALLYQYKATEVMKNQIDTYFDTQTEENEEELSLQDFRDLNKALNRAELLRYYQEEERLRIQEEKELELWA